jgi:hypothetical protein
VKLLMLSQAGTAGAMLPLQPTSKKIMLLKAISRDTFFMLWKFIILFDIRPAHLLYAEANISRKSQFQR